MKRPNHTLKLYTALIFYLYVFMTLSTPLFALASIKVDADIDSQFYEQAPIEGTIIISHSSKEPVDISSFKIESIPLQVEFKQEQPMTAPGDLVLSMYHFSLPPQPKGLHILPAIKVIIAGKAYQSIPRTYEVKTGNPPNPAIRKNQSLPTSSTPASQQPSPKEMPPTSISSTASSPPQTEKGPFLKLEAFVNGPSKLYPGQRTLVGYRFFYNINLQTSNESMPLLEAKGFTKIGDKTVKEEESEGMSVQQIEQMVEAVKPGDYIFGPSFLEAIPYQIDSAGRHLPSKEKLSSSVPMVVLNVKAFPEEGKPASFNGGVGEFNWKVQLASPSTVNAGDEIGLLIEASGKGNLEGLNLPELCCQPGMSGLFRMSDLPAVGAVTGDTKHFQVKLRPLSTSIKEIPSLEFSSFDPKTLHYVKVHSDPIPLSVTSLKNDVSPTLPSQSTLPGSTTSFNEPTHPTTTSSQQQQIPSSPSIQTTAPIEIESLYPLSANDLENLPFGAWYSLFLIPFGIGALLFQLNLFKYLSTFEQKPKLTTSQELFAKAIKAPLESSQRLTLFSQALLLSLKEKGFIPSANVESDHLPFNGIAGKVRDFLLEMEKDRYAGDTLLKGEEIQKRAQALFETIQSSGGPL